MKPPRRPTHQPDPLVQEAEAMPAKARRGGYNRRRRYGNSKGDGDFEMRMISRRQGRVKGDHRATSSS